MLTVWETNGEPVGYSTADKIRFGQRRSCTFISSMRCIGEPVRAFGACERRSACTSISYRLDHLFCEPNAFNVAPNRTLQRAGFRYVKAHMTVPGLLNYHQAVTRWVIEGSR